MQDKRIEMGGGFLLLHALSVSVLGLLCAMASLVLAVASLEDGDGQWFRWAWGDLSNNERERGVSTNREMARVRGIWARVGGNLKVKDLGKRGEIDPVKSQKLTKTAAKGNHLRAVKNRQKNSLFKSHR